MIKTIIIDDEMASREALAGLVRKYCPEIEVVAMADSVKTGIAAIEKHEPELIFLDVEMPFANGFDLLNSINNIDFEVIFTTAYDQYALKAIKFSALDYLLKPIDSEDLIEAVTKISKTKKRSSSVESGIHTLIQNLKTDVDGNKKIALPTLEGLEFVKLQDIIRCSATGNYTEFYLINDNKFISSKTLKQFEDILEDYNFFRAHHSHLINLDHIKKYYKGDGGHVVMTDGSVVTISKRKKPEFLEKLLKI